MKKTLTYQEHLEGLALFTMAQKHYAKSREFEAALCELVGVEDDDIYAGCISDAIYNDDSFEHGLKRQGISVDRRPAKPKAA